MNRSVEIKIADYGNSVARKIIEKIFQLFFTSKPTGSRSGLDLRLAYDIVKAHGGNLFVETKESDQTVFKIQLPY